MVLSTAMVQTGLHLARPLVSYRVIGLGGKAPAIDLVTVSFAVVPMMAAVPLGRVSDRLRSALDHATASALWVAGGVALVGLPFGIRKQPVCRAATAAGPSSLAVVRRPGGASSLFASLALLTSVDLLTGYLPLVAEQERIVPLAVGLLLPVRAVASIGSRLLLFRMVRGVHPTDAGHGELRGHGGGTGRRLAARRRRAVMALTLPVGGFFLGIGQPLTMTQVVQAVPTTVRYRAGEQQDRHAE